MESDGERSGMDREVVEERVVAMDAVVASSNDGGVQGRRSGRPTGQNENHRGYGSSRLSKEDMKVFLRHNIVLV